MNPRIEALQRRAAADPRAIIGLGGGLPAPELFPRAGLAASFLRALHEPSAPALQYGWAEGSEGLRGWIAERLRARGAEVAPDDVIITSGAQQALDIAAQVLGRRRGQGNGRGHGHGQGHRSIALCDAETYPSALDLFRSRGLATRTDMDIADDRDIALAYVMPAVSNPLGRGMEAPARRRLVERARRGRFAILEDDAYAELRFAGPPPRPMIAGERTRVWHVGTFSKTLSPGLRVGWLVPPRRWRARCLRTKQAMDLQSSSLAQSILDDFLRKNDYDRLVARACRFYARRAAVLVAALHKWLPSLRAEVPAGGFAVWLETGEAIDDIEFLDIAVRHGVSVDPGRSFRPGGNGQPLAMRLSFSIETGPRIEEGVRRLAGALLEAAGRRERTEMRGAERDGMRRGME